MLLQRRKKNLCFAGAALASIYLICHFMYWYDDKKFTALRPLYGAQNEAKRLLKFMVSYHYQCNTTVQLGNRSYWPVCTEPDGNINLDGKEPLLVYSIGPSEDLVFERNLAQNYSVHLVVVHHDRQVAELARAFNNTRALATQLMANDYADFSRNSYGQSTLNAVLERFHHQRMDLLKLEFVAGDVAMWEIVHFMIMDHLLKNVKQLYIAVSVDKLEDDYLYSWYRALYDLFYREGFRLYHTQASNPLCLQVTMMQSCIYYLSWMRNPGLNAFIMHPPADFGSPALERSRLLTYLNHHVTPDLCEEVATISDTDARLKFSYCQSLVGKQPARPCRAFVMSTSPSDIWQKALRDNRCEVHHYLLGTNTLGESVWDDNQASFHGYRYVPGTTSSRQQRHPRAFVDVEQVVANSDDVTLLVLDVADIAWAALTHLLDHNTLKVVSQLILVIRMDDTVDSSHQIALRRQFSELQRVEAHGFRMFSGVGTSLGPAGGQTHQLAYVRTSRL